MSDEGTSWEEDTVEAFFHEDLAEVILQIPISRCWGADFVSWPHDKFVQYIVCSAYNMARTSALFTRQGNVGHGVGSKQGVEDQNGRLFGLSKPLER
jgi:hypothetical protein